MMVKHLDFDAAKNVALACIESARAFQLNLVSQWNSCQRKSTDDALTSFQREAAKLFATLVDSYMQAENAMTKEVPVSLAKAGCNTNIPVARVNGRTFETWHEAEIELLYVSRGEKGGQFRGIRGPVGARMNRGGMGAKWQATAETGGRAGVG